MNLEQIIFYKKRFLTASLMMVPFFGTSHFLLPKSYYFNRRWLRVYAPPERGLAYDFINLFFDDEYGLKSLHHYPKTIVDIGANIGLFSQMAGVLFPEAKIHSYEPNFRLHDYLNKNLEQVAANFFSEAVGAEAGTGRSFDTGDSRTGVFEKGGDTPIVAFATVLERIGGTIDLLKIDCEGGEWDIFENAAPFQKVRMIRMEYHLVDGMSLEDLKKAAARIGFEIVKLEENSGFGIAWMEARNRKS